MPNDSRNSAFSRKLAASPSAPPNKKTTAGRSQRHVSAVADHLIKDIETAGRPRVRVEGMRQGDWVLIDAGDVIVHVFRPEVRAFYNLEKMWSGTNKDVRRPG